MPIKHLSWGMGRQRRLSGGTVPEPVADYQAWAIHPDSPVLTADYPYQWITYSGGSYRLRVAKGKWYVTPNETDRWSPSDVGKYYYRAGGPWTFLGDIAANAPCSHYAHPERQSNADIYTDNSYTTVYFAKTT